MTHKPTSVLLIVAACGLPFAAVHTDPISSNSSTTGRVEPLEIVVLGDAELARLEFRVEMEGKSVPEIWDQTFDRLFAYYDRNADGWLDKMEAGRAPSAFGLRQLLWGQSTPYSGPPLSWKDLDGDGNGKVTRDELASFYRRSGLGNVLIGVGRSRSAAALTTALLKGIDSDGNGMVSEAEWKAAASTLRKLDRNDDELIGPGELVPKTTYPGAVGAALLRPPAASDKGDPQSTLLPFIALPPNLGDTHWAMVVVTHRDRDKDDKLDAKECGLPRDIFARLDADGDGKLSAAELAAWRKSKATVRYVIRLGKRPAVESPNGSLVFAMGRLRIDVRADRGKMPEAVAVARKRFLDRFTEADRNNDGFLEEMEISKRNQYELQQLFGAADRDGDGKVSAKELAAWLDLQDQIASGHVLLTVLDLGPGLFEMLDADHDGSLSVSELRQAWDRVKETAYVPGGKFDAVKLPRQILLTVSRGHPLTPLGSARRDGPAWFRAMDRNGDGYVSRREFSGAAEQFDKLDLDKDGLLSSKEAEHARK